MRAAYTQQLLDRATAYVGQPLTARRYQEGMAEVTALYSLITGEAVGTCMQCQYSDFMAVINAYIREATRFLHPETVEDSKYTFAQAFANETIADGRYSKVVTADNLEDKDAEALIKLGYGHVIVKKGSKDAPSEGEGTSEATDVETENPVVPQADLEKEQQAHQATAKQLADAQAAHTTEKHKASEALKTEKDGHKATKNELAKLQKQYEATQKDLTAAQAQIAELTKPAATPEPETPQA